jgi:hypothetical protein
MEVSRQLHVPAASLLKTQTLYVLERMLAGSYSRSECGVEDNISVRAGNRSLAFQLMLSIPLTYPIK